MPWRSGEMEAAAELRQLLLTAASRSAARLEALLPMCAWCKRVRDEPGYWRGVEDFIQDLADVRLTHGLCPQCLEKQIQEYDSFRPGI